ncbi:hypothetical protein [Aneurinibacillus terranovensis]|uniref:hypothetical protein n=1 Tax=Aneurinibacillus terranovensis TaxID=278991 RepID=UPI0012DC8A13|nr:hypothetical protein [Aneurinibacillus terranovensis]
MRDHEEEYEMAMEQVKPKKVNEDKTERKQLIRSLTNKVCDRNDEGLRRLSKN